MPATSCRRGPRPSPNMATATARPQAVAMTLKTGSPRRASAARRGCRDARAPVVLADCSVLTVLPPCGRRARHGQTGVPPAVIVGQRPPRPSRTRCRGSARSRGRGDLRAVRVAPVEEREHRLGAGGVRLLLLHQDERRAGDGPRVRARLVDEDQVHARQAALPVGVGGRGGEGVEARRDERAVLVLELGGRHAGLLGVGVLDVADGAVELLHARGDALVALAADADRPRISLSAPAVHTCRRRRSGSW